MTRLRPIRQFQLPGSISNPEPGKSGCQVNWIRLVATDRGPNLETRRATASNPADSATAVAPAASGGLPAAPGPIEFFDHSPRKSTLALALGFPAFQTLIGLVGLLTYIVLAFVPIAGTALKITLVCVLGSAAGLLPLWLFLKRRRRVRAAKPSTDSGQSPLGRLVVCCDHEERASLAELPDTPFEPRIYWAGLSDPIVVWIETTNWVVASILFVLVLVLPSGWTRLPKEVPGPFVLWGMYGAMRIATSLLFPAYYRVLPGRVELLRYHPLGREPMYMKKLELRGRRVIVDRFQNVLIAESLDQPAKPAWKPRPEEINELSFAYLLDRRAFARDLVLAARSSAIAGPVRDDELVG